MNKLFIVSEEVYTSGYMPEVLTVISTFVVLCGVLVIISKNPIISVLFLIGLFSGIASYLIISGLSFIGLSYIIVYIGAVDFCVFANILCNIAALVYIQLYKKLLFFKDSLNFSFLTVLLTFMYSPAVASQDCNLNMFAPHSALRALHKNKYSTLSVFKPKKLYSTLSSCSKRQEDEDVTFLQ
jgi:NADH-ubiquinone oxidoreductase chain 6